MRTISFLDRWFVFILFGLIVLLRVQPIIFLICTTALIIFCMVGAVRAANRAGKLMKREREDRLKKGERNDGTRQRFELR